MKKKIRLLFHSYGLKGITLKAISIITLLSFSFSTTSCIYYKARNKPISETPVIDINKYTPDAYTFLVHFGEEVWQLSSVELDKSTDLVSGTVASIDPYVQVLYTGLEVGQTKRLRGQARYARQVHLYINEYNDLGDGKISIDGSNIEKVDVYNIDGVVTTLINVALSAVTLVAALAIILIIACNCPHVYVHDGVEYLMETSLFTGAVTKELERDDYKILSDYLSDEVKIKVINEEPELQHTNLLELLVVQHRPGAIVAPDARGNIYVVENPILPDRVYTSNNKNFAFETGEVDALPFRFDVEGENDLSDLYLRFDSIPQATKQVNLLLRPKNTTWGGIVYKEFISKFGGYYLKRTQKSQTRSGDKTVDWTRSQGIPLAVEIKEDGKWENAGYIDLVGEIDYTNVVLPIEVRDDGPIEIRLKSGFKFWELDYVALDVENQLVTDYQVLRPATALGHNGMDFKYALCCEDEVYMDHLNSGDFTEVHFKDLKRLEDMDRTLILRSKGYYQSNYTFTGSPKIGKLLKFKREGELSRQSLQLHDDFLKSVIISRNE